MFYIEKLAEVLLFISFLPAGLSFAISLYVLQEYRKEYGSFKGSMGLWPFYQVMKKAYPGASLFVRRLFYLTFGLQVSFWVSKLIELSY